MQRLTRDEMDAIKGRAEKATTGPWGTDYAMQVCDECDNDIEVVRSEVFLAPVVAELKSKSDAEFIAHAREDIPKLLAEVGRLTGVIDNIARQWERDREDYTELLSENNRLREVLSELDAHLDFGTPLEEDDGVNFDDVSGINGVFIKAKEALNNDETSED